MIVPLRPHVALKPRAPFAVILSLSAPRLSPGAVPALNTLARRRPLQRRVKVMIALPDVQENAASLVDITPSLSRLVGALDAVALGRRPILPVFAVAVGAWTPPTREQLGAVARRATADYMAISVELEAARRRP